MHQGKRMLSFNEFLVEYVIVQAPKHLIPNEAILNEGRWVPSGHKDYMMRVDAENPAIPLQRHVYIAQAKHVSSKNMQVAWNSDGSIHDKKSFNHQMATNAAVQNIAKSALKISPEIKLEESQYLNGNLLIESINESNKPPFEPYFLKVVNA
jgi:hypothetical protein